MAPNVANDFLTLEATATDCMIWTFEPFLCQGALLRLCPRRESEKRKSVIILINIIILMDGIVIIVIVVDGDGGGIDIINIIDILRIIGFINNIIF